MTNEAVTPNFSNGDVVCMKGGVTWTDPIAGQNGVTYASDGGDTAACDDWGSGYAIIDVPLATGAYGALQLDGNDDNIVVDGLRLINRDTTSADAKCGLYVEGASDNSILNLTVLNVEGTESANGLCLIGYVNRFSITYSDFSDNIGNIAQAVCNGSGLLLSNKAGSSNVINGIVRYNTMRRNGPTCFNGADSEGRGVTFINQGSAVVFEFNTMTDNGASPDGAAMDAGGYDGVTLRGNYFDGYTAAEIKADADFWVMSGNVFVGRSTAIFQYGHFSTDSVGSSIVNNTFVSLTKTGSAVVSLSSPGSTTVFRNNLILCPPGNTVNAITFSQVSGWEQSTWNTRFSHNYVEGCTTFTDEVTSIGGHIQRTLAAHQAAYPLQAQSSLQHSDLSVLDTDVSPRTYKLTPSSSAYHVGAPLGMCMDVRDRACPPDRPSIGAYQSTSGDPAATRAVRN